MIVLHAAYKNDRFFIWGERNISATAEVEDRFASAAEIADALSAAGISNAAHPSGGTAELLLPTSGGVPMPSTPLLYGAGEVLAMEEGLALRGWKVGALPMSVFDVIEMGEELTIGELSEHGSLASPGVMIALDMCFVAECARCAMSLIDRGRFLPDVREVDDGTQTRYESVWRPLLVGEDAERFSSLARSMPGVIMANLTAKRVGRHKKYETIINAGDDEKTATLRSIFERLMDTYIRQTWADRHKGAGIADKKKRGRLVSALNPHALWASSLGWLGDAEGLSVSLESIWPDVREWWDRFEWFAKAPFKLSVALSDEPSSRGEWSLSYSLKLLTTGESIPAADVWTAKGTKKARAFAGYMRRYMLLLLGRIGAIVSGVRRSLYESSPSGCVLSMTEASDFLDFQASSLEGIGVGIGYPSWWSEGSADRLTLRGRLVSGTVDPVTFAYTAWSDQQGARGETLKFDWHIALDGELLTHSETKLLTEGEQPLVNIRGRWVFIHRGRIDAVVRHGRQLPTKMTAGEAVRLAVRDRYIDGFADAPDLELVYKTLKNGMPRVDLGAPSGMVGALRPYQRRGFSWMAFLTSLGFGVCLADDMGLGKTVQTLALVQHYRDMGDGRPVLLVCPTSVLENWRTEAAKFFPEMPVYIHHGRSRARSADFMRAISGKTIVITSYSIMVRDAKTLQGVDWIGVVMDEAQNIKNPDTHQSRLCRTMRAEWRVALTGTPIENHVGDIWSIMEFLMPDMLGSRARFRVDYIKPIQEDRDRSVMDALRRQVSPLILRRMKTDRDIAPELPEKIETKVHCPLTREQSQLYTMFANEMARDVAGAEGIKRRGIVLAALTRIKQVCDHPELIELDGDMSAARSSKLERLLALADEMFESRSKALIFTQYVGMGEILKTQLQERFGREVMFFHGSLSREARDEIVRRFQESRGPQFLVMSLRAGGVGLNLTAANHVVMFDRWWNPAVEQQAIDRAYRIGQKRAVQVHTFCCTGTIEERIDALLESKRELADSMMDGTENWITELSDRDLQRLVALRSSSQEG